MRSEVYTVMQGLSKSLPMYVWLVALSQLTSRICHPHEETKHLTQHILTRVIAAFPHQVCLQKGFRSCSGRALQVTVLHMLPIA